MATIIAISDAIRRSLIYKRLDDNLKGKTLEICEKVIPSLELIPGIFPEYTPHGLSHVATVINNLEILLESCLDLLDQNQLFCLLLAVVIHDIGMGPISSDESDAWRSDEKQKELVRQRHHVRSESFVLSSPVFASISDHQRRAIGRIAKGHRIVSLHSIEYLDKNFPIRDLAFLSAALRLADELEITYKRIEFLDIFSEKKRFLLRMSEESKIHWEAHLCLNSWNLSGNREVLVINGIIMSDLGHRAVELVQKSIWKTIKEIRDILFENKHIFPLKEDFKLEFQGFAGREYKIQLESRTVIDYLIESLYSDERVAIREVIQNAIDGCQLRGQESTVYHPEINIEFSNNCLVVTDNGRGMDLDIIQKYLTVIGRSFYRSPDFETFVEFADFEPDLIGRFGIGIGSLFLISDTFKVRTRFRVKDPKEDSNWLETRFTRAFCPTYFIAKPSETYDFGTQVIIELKESYLDSIKEEIVPYLRRTFIRPRVPIFYSSERRLEIAQFPRDKPLNLPNDPIINSNENGIDLWAQNSDDVFIGVKIRRFEGEVPIKSRKIIRRKKELKKDDRILICSEGTLLELKTDYQFSYSQSLQRARSSLRFFYELCESIFGRIKGLAIIDIAAKHLKLTINRESLRAGSQEIETALRDLRVALEKGILSLKKSPKIREEDFWDIYLEKYYNEATITDISDFKEGIQFSRLRKGDQIVRICDITEDDEKIIPIKAIFRGMLSLEKMHGSSIRIEGELETTGSEADQFAFMSIPEFIFEHLFDKLLDQGWKIEYLTSEMLKKYVGIFSRSHSIREFWEKLPKLIDLHPDNLQFELAMTLLPFLDRASHFEYHLWLRKKAVRKGWGQIADYLRSRGELPVASFITMAFIASRLNRTDITESLVEEFQQRRADKKFRETGLKYDLACLLSVLNRNEEALSELREYAVIIEPHARWIQYPWLLEDPDLESLREEFPREFGEIAENLKAKRNGQKMIQTSVLDEEILSDSL